MATKRMFSLKIVDSDLFLDMPMSARLLYYDLCMRADDEGFVGNPRKIMRITGASNDDMNILINKKFVIYCDSGIVVVKQWYINNYIRSDRFQPTMYQEEKSQLELNDSKEYVVKSEQEKIEPPKQKNEEKHKYGEFKHVVLTDKQYESLKEKYKESLDEHIRILDEYCETSGKTYKNYALVIQGWVHEKYEKNKPQEQVKLDEKFYAPKIEKTDEEVHEDFEKIRKELFG